MALVTLHTKLTNVNDSAVKLKYRCGYDVYFLANNLVSIGQLFRMSAYYLQNVNDVCIPYETNTALAAYADEQFVMQFYLLERLVAVHGLLDQAIADITTITTPYTVDQLYNDNMVIVDGETIYIEGYDSTATAALQTTLQTIYDNIPE